MDADFEWDSRKAAENRRKHGVSLEDGRVGTPPSPHSLTFCCCGHAIVRSGYAATVILRLRLNFGR